MFHVWTPLLSCRISWVKTNFIFARLMLASLRVSSVTFVTSSSLQLADFLMFPGQLFWQKCSQILNFYSSNLVLNQKTNSKKPLCIHLVRTSYKDLYIVLRDKLDTPGLLHLLTLIHLADAFIQSSFVLLNSWRLRTVNPTVSAWQWWDFEHPVAQSLNNSALKEKSNMKHTVLNMFILK